MMGTIAKIVLKKEFEMPLSYPVTTGFEFVATRKSQTEWNCIYVTARKYAKSRI